MIDSRFRLFSFTLLTINSRAFVYACVCVCSGERVGGKLQMIYYWCTVIAAVRYLRHDQSVRDGWKEDRPCAIASRTAHTVILFLKLLLCLFPTLQQQQHVIRDRLCLYTFVFSFLLFSCPAERCRTIQCLSKWPFVSTSARWLTFIFEVPFLFQTCHWQLSSWWTVETVVNASITPLLLLSRCTCQCCCRGWMDRAIDIGEPISNEATLSEFLLNE